MSIPLRYLLARIICSTTEADGEFATSASEARIDQHQGLYKRGQSDSESPNTLHTLQNLLQKVTFNAQFNTLRDIVDHFDRLQQTGKDVDSAVKEVVRQYLPAVVGIVEQQAKHNDPLRSFETYQAALNKVTDQDLSNLSAALVARSPNVLNMSEEQQRRQANRYKQLLQDLLTNLKRREIYDYIIQQRQILSSQQMNARKPNAQVNQAATMEQQQQNPAVTYPNYYADIRTEISDDIVNIFSPQEQNQLQPPTTQPTQPIVSQDVTEPLQQPAAQTPQVSATTSEGGFRLDPSAIGQVVGAFAPFVVQYLLPPQQPQSTAKPDFLKKMLDQFPKPTTTRYV